MYTNLTPPPPLSPSVRLVPFDIYEDEVLVNALCHQPIICMKNSVFEFITTHALEHLSGCSWNLWQETVNDKRWMVNHGCRSGE